MMNASNHAVRVLPAALLSLLFTYFFFIEYLPPVRHVHIPYDLQGYHYPENDYAFLAVRHGRLPEWDPTIYCGMSFAANVQTQLFYPPMWLLYLANWQRERMSYLTLEVFDLLHVWLAFLLCYLWLRRRNLLTLAATIGAGIYAYGGYLMLNIQHLGLVSAYAWVPLGFMGIDEMLERRSWRPLWKLALASTFAFLAGYPPTWIVIAMCWLVYAALTRPFGWKPVAGVLAAIAVSLLLCGVQLLPAMETAGLKEKVAHYGTGSHELRYYLPYLFPNYFDYGIKKPVMTNYGYEYLYMGTAAMFGLFFLVRRFSLRDALPFLGILAASLIFFLNPFGLVWAVIGRSSMLADVVRSWYFLAGVAVAMAPLAAFGIDRFLRSGKRPAPGWTAGAVAAAVVIWSIVQIRIWLPSGEGFPAGLRSGLYPAVTLTLLTAAMLLYRAVHGAWKYAAVAAIMLAIGVDYKVFGTSLRMNAGEGDVDRTMRFMAPFPGMARQTYEEIHRNPEYRLILDQDSGSTDFRHYDLSTPQGMDPLMPAQYRYIAGNGPGEKMQEIDAVRQKDLLRLLAVRYIASSEGGPRYAAMVADPDFRRLPGEAYYKVFEFLGAKPAYRWDRPAPGDAARKTAWRPEDREFDVHSAAGGRFVLVEQADPGWQASIDGKPVAIAKWADAFQSVAVPPGDHHVAFRYRSRSMRWGAALSVAALLGLVLTYRLAKVRQPERVLSQAR